LFNYKEFLMKKLVAMAVLSTNFDNDNMDITSERGLCFIKKTISLFGNPNRACHRQASHPRCAVPLMIIALIAVIGFSFGACKDGSDPVGTTGYTVSFNSNGGSAVPSQIVDSGGTANRPADPTRSLYTFDDWYSNTGLTTVYDFSTPVTGDITLYAKWNPVGYTVSFNSNGGSAVPSQPVDSGGTATRPADPTRSGYAFDDWYSNTGLTTVYDFTTPVTSDITLHAKWNPRLVAMEWIQGGTFTMGSPVSEPGRYAEESEHSVTLTGFYMGKYLVTQAQFEEVTGNNPSSFKTAVPPEASTANRPVETVTWHHAIVFCNMLSMREGMSPVYEIPTVDNYSIWSTDPATWGEIPDGEDENNINRWNDARVVTGSTGYRLPTEAQWEYACRAGSGTAYNWGTNTIDDSKANYNASTVNDNNPVAGTYLQRTTEVGKYAANAWGLYDMHGNVYEWCGDWYTSTYYSSSPAQGPTGPASGSGRVVRGGCYSSGSRTLRSASRDPVDPVRGSGYYGFRIVYPAQ
jgi:uncharacterized repeat protein (TIGR02543 family)